MLIKAENKVWIVNFNYGEVKRKKSKDTYWKLRTTTVRMRPHGFAKGVNETSCTVTCDSREDFTKVNGRKKVIRKILSFIPEFESVEKRAEFWANYIAQVNV